MNLKQARYFVTIVEEGSITAAAKKLYVTQPSLSQMLHQIEQESGAELLSRTPLPMKPTYAGEKYLECARSAILERKKNRHMSESDICLSVFFSQVILTSSSCSC